MAKIKTYSGKLVDRWTQSTVYYLFVPIMQRLAIKLQRKTITNYIRGIAKEFGTTREKLGIIASPRSIMYFDGVWTAVSFDAIKTLATNGTDIIFIEKLDIVEVFTDYADRDGIAMVNTVGHLTEYGKDLVEEAKEEDGHPAIFTDNDASGYKMWLDIPTEIPRLGVDQEMLDYFGLDKNSDSIRIMAPPPENQINSVRDAVEAAKEKAEQDRTNKEKILSKVDVDFLETHKVEIDAVLAAVGSERLWKYLTDKLKQYYKSRDYTKVIATDIDLSEHLPEAIRNFQTYIKGHCDSLTEKERKKIDEELDDVEGFISVPDKKEEVDKRLGKFIEDDQHLKNLALIIEDGAKKAGYDITKFRPLLKKESEVNENGVEER